MDASAAISELVIANRLVAHLRLVDSFGHVTVRNPENSQRFFMSRARAPGLVEPSDIMEFGMDGEPIRDDGRPIYSERFIHSEIYLARPDVNGVVHSHSPTVVPFTVTNVPLKPIRAAFFYPEVPLFDTRDTAGWTNLLISDRKLGKALAEKLGKNSVVLLRGHGNAVVGASVRMAVYRAVYTEANAKLLLQAKMLGGPINYLAPEEAAIMESSQMTHRPGHGTDRIWELLKSEAIARTGRPKR